MGLILKKTITETFLERVKASPDRVAFSFKQDQAWVETSFKQFYEDCRLISYGLSALGVQPGDRVALLANTRYEWPLCDMAVLGTGAITIPIYASSVASDVTYILHHSDARVAFVEDWPQLQKVLSKKSELPYLEKIVLFDAGAVAMAGRENIENLKKVLSLQALRELGRREEARAPARFENQLRTARPDDLITICYTSGTTGTPKGVMLTHDNMMSILEDCVEFMARYIVPEREVLLSFLPYSHILGKVESMAIYTFGWKNVFAESLEKLMQNLQEIKPTILFAVPRIFEKALTRVEEMIASETLLKRRVFQSAFQTGMRYYGEVWSRRRPSLLLGAEYAIAKNLVLSQVARRLGGRLKFAICGGAPLSKDVAEFFQILGIQVLEGYGLTETCAPVAVNTPEHLRFGTVGRPLPEVSIKIAEDGEILVKSRKVFRGYYKAPEETAEALRSGWLHTGDIGRIDSDGFLTITDRKKDMIVTSAGKNIAPQKIESLIKIQPFINHIYIHGDRRNYLTALVTLDRAQALSYAAEHQILFSEYRELVKNPRIVAWVQSLMDELNQQLASFETIKKFIILPGDFTVESGELTPSLKVRRNVVAKHYRELLDAMYDQPRRSELDSTR